MVIDLRTFPIMKEIELEEEWIFQYIVNKQGDKKFIDRVLVLIKAIKNQHKDD